MTLLLPKDNPYFIGHEKAESLFLKSFEQGTLHHALLISGPKGIGKATFAYKIARFLLAHQNEATKTDKLDISSTDPVFKQISSGSNPNFLAIERDYIQTDKNKIIKAIKDGEPLGQDELQDLKKSAVIKVDEIRQIHAFLSKKSFDDSWRVVIVDSVDELNSASANAILKILEEPPQKSILLLISHQPSKLLPTIRSRCAKLTLSPLSSDCVASLLRRYVPDLNENEVVELSKISNGSIGSAINYALHDGLELYKKLQRIIYAGANFDLREVLDLATFAASDENAWDLTEDLFLKIIQDMVASNEKTEEFYQLYTDILKINADVLGLNMDKKHALINMLYHCSKVVSNAC